MLCPHKNTQNDTIGLVHIRYQNMHETDAQQSLQYL